MENIRLELTMKQGLDIQNYAAAEYMLADKCWRNQVRGGGTPAAIKYHENRRIAAEHIYYMLVSEMDYEAMTLMDRLHEQAIAQDKRFEEEMALLDTVFGKRRRTWKPIKPARRRENK